MIRNLYVLITAEGTLISFVDSKKNLLSRLHSLHVKDYVIYKSNSRDRFNLSYFVSTPGFFELYPNFDFSSVKFSSDSSPVLVHRRLDDFDNFYLTFLDDTEYSDLLFNPDYIVYTFSRNYCSVSPLGDIPQKFINGEVYICVKPN